MLKPALCAAALCRGRHRHSRHRAAIAAGDTPSANSPAPQTGPEGRGPWVAIPMTGTSMPLYREAERYRGDDDDGPRRHGPRFGGREGMMNATR